jgi:nickel transport protein
MPYRIAAVALALALLTAADAGAHVVHIEWKVAAPDLVVVAYFDNDLPADEAEVALHDPDGTVVAAGKTDDTGSWKCPSPPPGSYRLVVRAIPGHEKTVPIVIEPAAAPAGEPATPSDSARPGVVATAVAAVGVVVLLLWVRRKRNPTPPAG